MRNEPVIQDSYMSKLKEQIFELRKNGASYGTIVKELGCSKSTVAYHCNDTEKKNTRKRQEKRRLKNPVAFYGEKKLDNFKRSVSKGGRKKAEKITINKMHGSAIDRFKRANSGSIKRKKSILSEDKFTFKDVVEKYKGNQKCYLTGRDIDFNSHNTFSFDHIVPTSKGGKNTLDNLGLCCLEVNFAKSDLSVDEFIDLCKDVLINFDYKVEKNIPG
jgi:DNA-binding CsgD family transcriptional regulator